MPRTEVNDRSGLCPICLSSRVRVVRIREGFPIQNCKSCHSDSAILTHTELPSYDAHYEDESHYAGYYKLAKNLRAGKTAIYWYQSRMLKEAGWGSEKVHIDVGSGLGTFLAVTKERGWKPLGVDVSARAACTAKELFDIDTFVGDLLNLKRPAGSVGWISAFEVLEHTFAPRDYVDRIHELLLPGGLVTISVPNGRSRNEKYNHDPILVPPTHINFFSQRGLRKIFGSAGFVTVYDYMKPLAWGELKMPKALKIAMLPLLVLDRIILGHAGNRLLWVGRKKADPSEPPP
jgi:SAM-dependent methyltransferase